MLTVLHKWVRGCAHETQSGKWVRAWKTWSTKWRHGYGVRNGGIVMRSVKDITGMLMRVIVPRDAHTCTTTKVGTYMGSNGKTPSTMAMRITEYAVAAVRSIHQVMHFTIVLLRLSLSLLLPACRSWQCVCVHPLRRSAFLASIRLQFGCTLKMFPNSSLALEPSFSTQRKLEFSLSTSLQHRLDDDCSFTTALSCRTRS